MNNAIATSSHNNDITTTSSISLSTAAKLVPIHGYEMSTVPYQVRHNNKPLSFRMFLYYTIE